MVVSPPNCSICCIFILSRPRPMEIMTTMDAVPTTTPKTVNTVLSFLRHRLLKLILNKSI